MKTETTTPAQPAVLDDVEIEFEELEEKIAPGNNLNHNETFVNDDLETEVEELEDKVAPGLNLNHNETFVRD